MRSEARAWTRTHAAYGQERREMGTGTWGAPRHETTRSAERYMKLVASRSRILSYVVLICAMSMFLRVQRRKEADRDTEAWEPK